MARAVTEEHLADGWEPGLEGDTLLRAGFEAWAAELVHTARAMGGRAEDHGDVVLADSGFPSLFFTGAFLRGPVGVERIAEVLPFFRGEHAVVSPVPTPDLRPLGLSLVGHPPLMVRPAGGTPPPATLEVEEVVDADGMAAWEACLVEAFPLPGAEHWSPGAAYDERVLGGEARFWLGREAGEVVATSAAVVHGGVVWVTSVSSRVRRRGHGESLTWAATMADPSLPALLVASDPGRPIYQRMGYLPVSRFTFWSGAT